MAEWNDAAARRWLIGAELRHYRETAGRTAVEAAAELGCTPGKINHLESGRNQQQPHEVRLLLKYYGADHEATEKLTELTGRPEQRAWWSPWSDVIAPWFERFAGLESQASTEFLYEPIFVPGLLQTEAYARAVTAATSRVRSDHLEDFVGLRRARADLLTGKAPLRLHVVIGESALRLRVGEEAILQEQYRHLMQLAELPNIEMQVLCPESGVHDGFTGAFAILGLPGAHTVGYVELQDDAVYIHDQRRMRGYTMAAENLRAVALSPTESVQLISSFLTS